MWATATAVLRTIGARIVRRAARTEATTTQLATEVRPVAQATRRVRTTRAPVAAADSTTL